MQGHEAAVAVQQCCRNAKIGTYLLRQTLRVHGIRKEGGEKVVARTFQTHNEQKRGSSCSVVLGRMGC